MSKVASWAYTAAATVWPVIGRDDWSGAVTYGAPVVIGCDYKAEAKAMRDDRGDEFVSRLTVYTEHASAKMGDRLKLGQHADAQPPADAQEVRTVQRFADTFDRQADDYALIT